MGARKQKKTVIFWGVYLLFLLLLVEIGSFAAIKLMKQEKPADIAALEMIAEDDAYIWSYKKNFPFQYTVEGNTVSSSINSMGTHDAEWSSERLDKPNRILAIGDSFTFGWGVSLADTWWGQLKRLLNSETSTRYPDNSWDTFGTGMWMATFDQHYLVAKRYIDHVRPKYVVHGVYLPHLLTISSHQHFDDDGGDLVKVIDPLIGVRSNRLVYSLKGGGMYVLPEFPFSMSLYKLLYKRHLFLDSLEELAGTRARLNFDDIFRPEHKDGFRDAYEKMYRSIELTDKLVSSSGARYIVVLIPYVRNVLPGEEESKPEDLWVSPFPYDEVEAKLESVGIQTINLLDTFRSDTDAKSLYFETDPHFTARGHELMARKIKGLIEKIESTR